MASQAVALPDLEYLLKRIANGAFLRDLAAETGIDKRRLSEQLRLEPGYPAAKEAAIECQLDDAETLIAYAEETADIARAREVWRAATWRAERECAHRWGQKVEITHYVDVRIALAEARSRAGRTIESDGYQQDSEPALPNKEADSG